MASNTVTVTLEGEVPFGTFAETAQAFNELIATLQKDVSGGASIEWVVADLVAGSASVTLRAETQKPEDAHRVVGALGSIFKSLSGGRPVYYAPAIESKARAVLALVKGRVEGLRVQADDTDVSFGPSEQVRGPVGLPSAYGAMEGRVETVSSRGTLKFILYDVLFDEAVWCFLERGQEDIIRNLWGQQVIVRGRIHRSPTSGRATSIKEITTVTVAPPSLGDFENARGILPWEPGEDLPEVRIRRARDAS